MPYFRVDDDFPQHPKVLAIPRRDRVAAVGLWTLAGAWCSRNLTDGRLAKHMVEELGSSKKYAQLLVSTGLWTEDGDTYTFHQFVPWQGASREEVLAKRDAEADRKRRWREAKAAKRAENEPPEDGPVPDLSQRDNPRTDNGTTPSVRPESAPRPLLPSPPLPSPPRVPFGDTWDGETREGVVTEVDARASNDPLPLESPLCHRHDGQDRDSVPPCTACRRLRQQWEADVAAANRPAARPSWCGTCDEHSRLTETTTGMTRCPTCHPLAHGAAS